MFERIGQWVARHRRIVVGAWVVLVVAGGALGGGVFDNTATVEDSPEGSESLVAQQRLDAFDPEGPMISAVIGGADFYTPELRESATAVMPTVREVPGVVDVTDAYTSGGLIAADGRSSLVTVELDPALSEDEARVAAAEVSALLRTIEPADVVVGGRFLAEQSFVDRAVTDAAIGEGVAILVLFVILVVVLGGVRVALLPIIAAIAVIATSLLALSALIVVVPVNEFAVNIVTILSLALAVDYSLLVIARFREERRRSPLLPVEDVMAATVGSSGRAVLVSGGAVFIVLLGLMLLGNSLLTGMAVGGAAAVLLATLAGVTLVPALIAMLVRHIPAEGRRLWPLRSAPADVQPRPGILARLAAFAQRRPVAVAIGSAVVLLVLAAPLTTLTLGSSDIRSLPLDSEERRTAAAVVDGFPDLSEAAATVLIDARVSDDRVPALLDQIAANDLVVDAETVVDLAPDVTVVEFSTRGDVSGADAQQLVREIRAMDTELTISVTGPAAEVVDTESQLLSRLPLALGVVLLSTFALLMLLTRSFVIPLKAVVLNALTVGATVGSVVAIFQWGWGAGILGFEAWGAVDVTSPLLIALLSFGLSMDYEVFLLSRISEEWRARDTALSPRAANDRAVLRGITATGPVVTTAAVAIAVVFIGFASGGLLAMKEVGVGMAIAILLDVTIVRGLLLPALMTLLGGWNWVGPRRPVA